MPTPTSGVWTGLSLGEVIRSMAPLGEASTGQLSLATQLLFHALHARGWPGCLVEQEVVLGSFGVQFHFLRWNAETLNLRQETMPQALEALRKRRPEAQYGMSRVATAPDASVVDQVEEQPEDYARARSAVDALFLAQSAPLPTASAHPHRL